MADESSMKTVLLGKTAQPIGRRAGIGSLFTIVAAVIGLVLSAGRPLMPLPSMDISVLIDPAYYFVSTGFLGLMTAGLFFQMIGSRNLRNRLGSSHAYALHLAFIMGLILTIYVPLNAPNIVYAPQIAAFLTFVQLWSALFIIFWQICSLVYADASESWIGFIPGISNAFFFPFLAIGQALGSIFIYAAYALLLVGQITALLFWWSPTGIVRGYARSTSKAKFAFGLSGVITLLIGFLAAFNGPIQMVLGIEIWYPWSSIDSNGIFYTNPVLLEAFLAAMLFWVMLAPRLGAKELKETHIREDLIKGGLKWFMVFMAILGMITAGQAGTGLEGAASWALLLSWCPGTVLFLMGGLYAANTDLVIGLPLVLTAIFVMVHPYSLLFPVMIAWILAIASQVLLMIETIIRGYTSYSQSALSVITTLIASVIFILFLLGGFGTGPTAIWPTHRWFNVTLLTGVPIQIQTPTIVILPILVLLVRNVALAGFSHGREYSGGMLIMGMSAMFALLIPLIAGSEGIVHQANTAAAILLALYAISFVMVLSLNLNLAGDVEDAGHPVEGTLLRITTVVGMVLGAIVAIISLAIFAGFPTALDVAFVITLLVTIIVGLEILLLLGWTSAGIRLGMIREGFKFHRAEYKL